MTTGSARAMRSRSGSAGCPSPKSWKSTARAGSPTARWQAGICGEPTAWRKNSRLRVMVATTVFRRRSMSVVDCRCSFGPNDEPFVEHHSSFSVSYVRKGSFGYRVGGESFELVAGSILVGRLGDAFMCTHEHAYGDECLSFRFG